jgi:hypothetical protein
MCHTSFAGTREEADERFDAMRRDLESLLDLCPDMDDTVIDSKLPALYAAIERFVDRY